MPLSLKDLIRQGEHQTQDFKFRVDDQKKIARTICAFANTDGGRLLIGVKDSGKITGIHPEEEFHMIEGATNLYCKPPVPFTTKIWQEDFRLVMEVNVEANPARSHHAPDETGSWRIYIRRGDHTLIANKILLKIWSLEKKGIPKPQHFGKEEQDFLRLFGNEKMTLSRLYRLSSLPKNQVDHLVALFTYWEILVMEMSEEKTVYALC